VTDEEYDRIRDEAYVDRGFCMFPDSHAPGHELDQVFGVRFYHVGEWEDLTETEMVEKYAVDGVLPGFLHSSDWDFWYSP
jgi:hypothetical protein